MPRLQNERIKGVYHKRARTLEIQLLKAIRQRMRNRSSWRYLNGGYTRESVRACDPCPVGEKSNVWQEGELNRRRRMEKCVCRVIAEKQWHTFLRMLPAHSGGEHKFFNFLFTEAPFM